MIVGAPFSLQSTMDAPASTEVAADLWLVKLMTIVGGTCCMGSLDKPDQQRRKQVGIVMIDTMSEFTRREEREKEKESEMVREQFKDVYVRKKL